MLQKNFLTAFNVPDAALSVIDKIVLPSEQRIIENTDGTTWRADNFPPGFAARAYKRGILSIDDGGQYTLSSFYGRLDVFVISEPLIYRSFLDNVRKALDEWYFDAYYKQLDVPADKVITLEEAFAKIEGDKRQVYLAPCDCRSLSGDCAKPVITCLSWRNGTNTFAHRGWSEPISKNKAKEIVQNAEKDALMHTANADTICNCCKDCCYLMRARKRMAKEGRDKSWINGNYVISHNGTLCTKCGKCVKRCNMGVFTINKSVSCGQNMLNINIDECIGCGICVPTCKSGALTLKKGR